MAELKKALIMAGGTGGHVFPGLAVARSMREKNIEVHWLGTEKGLEARVVPEAGIPIHYISISGVRGKGIKSLLLAPFQLTKAIAQAARVLRQLKPDVVLGMGGFVSGPGGIAAWLLRYPLVIHEQNAKAGTTNTWLSRVAKKILEGFPKTFPDSKKLSTIGNPVRTEIANLDPPEMRLSKNAKPFRLLVLGGSLGAQALNDLVPKALALLSSDERPEVLHQTGEKHLAQAQQAYQAAGVNAEIVPFIHSMDKAYSSADLVICRAGALTIAELCVVGIGAILVPFPFAVDDHQTTNGNFMVEKNAAILIQQKELTAEKLAALLKDFYLHPEKCIAMAKAAYGLRRANATEEVVAACKEVSL